MFGWLASAITDEFAREQQKRAGLRRDSRDVVTNKQTNVGHPQQVEETRKRMASFPKPQEESVVLRTP